MGGLLPSLFANRVAEEGIEVAEEDVGGRVVVLSDLVDHVVVGTDASLVGELPLQRIHGVTRDSQEDISQTSGSVGELLHGAANLVHFLSFRWFRKRRKKVALQRT
jgi:hypothetical protein